MALLAAFSCTREEDWWQDEISRQARNDKGGRIENPFVREVHFRAEQTDTKAQFGELENGAYPTLWTSNDSQVKLSLNYGTAVAADVIKSTDSRSASFDASFDFSGVTGPYTFYSVSPASAAIALSPSREAWKVTIPSVQTPSAGSVDEAGIILASTSVEYVSISDVSDVDLYFTHLTAYGRMSLSNLALGSGEAVSAVELTVTTPIVGDWYWNTAGTSITDYGASSTLTINTTRTTDIWFACAPVDVSGELMTVTVFTNLGYYEQLVEFPADRQFTAGQAAVFSVNMNGADYTAYSGGAPSGDFTLVTDASTLAAGDEIIITNIDADKALGPASTGSTAYRQAVTVGSEGSILTSLGSATVLTLRAGSVSGTWALDTGNGYLAPTGSKNSLGTSSSISDVSSWAISIVGGEAAISAQSGTYYRLLYNYNQGSGSRFSAYGSSSTLPKPAIYSRSTGGSAPSADPMLGLSEYGCYLGSGLNRVLTAGVDQVTRAYNGDGVLTYTIINAAAVEELEISGYTKDKLKGSAVSLTVNWRIGASSVLSSAYTMKVIKEEGPKVWLSDGNGKGVIIKK
jgi:hypothetical protein